MQDKSKAFILWGASGAGKDTQAEKLTLYFREKGFNTPDFCSVGKILREMLEEGSSDNFFLQKIKNTMETGGLLPEFVPIWAWTRWLHSVAQPATYYILNGVARKPREGPVLLDALTYLGVKDPVFIVLKVSEKELIRRLLKRGRLDDTEEGIKKRLGWYGEETLVAIDVVKKAKGSVIEIDGEGPKESVLERIKKTLEI